MITVCIPTLNRKEYLKRLLKFYSDQDFPYLLYVGISDPLSVFNELEEFKNLLNISNQITFFHTPKLDVLETLNILLKNSSSKYSILQSDDDYLMHDTLEDMKKILEDDNSFIGANAKALILHEKTGFIEDYEMRGLSKLKATDRLNEFSGNYFAIHMCLFRTVDLVKIFSLPEISSKPIREEIYVSFKTAIMGKIFHLNSLFLIRTVDHKRTSLGRVDLSDLISLRKFKDDMISEILDLDEIEKCIAEETFDSAILNYTYSKKKTSSFSKLKTLFFRILVKFFKIILKNPNLSKYDLSPFNPWKHKINSVKELYFKSK